jgi:D-glycero-D-manno-heptose 1,7-bisphosphate phosphatase
MNKAVFLDRDGVINVEVSDYIMRLEDFVIHPYAIHHICTLHTNGYKVIVVTNQGGIAKGLYTEEVMNRMHQRLIAEVEQAGGHIDEIYYCPHHPVTGKCLCRKPESLMVEKGLAKYGIDPLQSVFVGDKPRDIEAAVGAGVRGILIGENEDWAFVVDELLKN